MGTLVDARTLGGRLGMTLGESDTGSAQTNNALRPHLATLVQSDMFSAVVHILAPLSAQNCSASAWLSSPFFTQSFAELLYEVTQREPHDAGAATAYGTNCVEPQHFVASKVVAGNCLM